MSSLRDAVIVLGGLALAMVLYACSVSPAQVPQASPLATPAAQVSPLATPTAGE